MDRPSLADRIRSFKSSFSAASESSQNFSTHRIAPSDHQYKSIDDIVSLLRTRAIESVPQESTEEMSSIIEDLRSKNSEISISSTIRRPEPPPSLPDHHVNIHDLVRKLTVDEEDIEESADQILARIKSKLEQSGGRTYPGSGVLSHHHHRNVLIDPVMRHDCGVEMANLIQKNNSSQMIQLDSTCFDSCSRVGGGEASVIPDLVLLPHQGPYIESEIVRIRNKLYGGIK